MTTDSWNGNRNWNHKKSNGCIRVRSSSGRLAFGAGALAIMALASGSGARAATLKTLCNFCAQGTATCPDGQSPSSGLISDGSGGFYGTTFAGGANGQGTVFQLVRTRGANGPPAWTVKTLYAFCTQGGADCTDGAIPLAWNLLKDEAENLYGTTINGGRIPRMQTPAISIWARCTS